MTKAKNSRLDNSDPEAILELLDKHLDSKFPTTRSLGKEKIDYRATLLIDDILLIEKIAHKDLDSSITLLARIYSESPKFFGENFSGLKRVQDEVGRIVVSLSAFGTKKPIGYQKTFLKETKAWVENDLLRPLALKILAKLLELRGTEATSTFDKDTLNIQNFILKLDEKVHTIRSEALNQLFTAFNETKEVKEKIQIIATLENALRAAIYSQHSGSSPELAKEETDLVVDFVDSELTEGSLRENSPRNFDIVCMVESLLERLIEYKDRDYENPKIPILLSIIKDKPGYKLFQVLIHPRFPIKKPPKGWRASDAIREAVGSFGIEQLPVLKDITEYASKSGAIYNSIKTLFHFLGEIQPPLLETIVLEELDQAEDAIWYYLGYGIGSLLLETKHEGKAEGFIERISKSPVILQRKAIVDALYEVGRYGTSAEKKKWAAAQLLSLVESVNKNKKEQENWHFKWSVSDAVGELFTPRKTSKICFQILEGCVRDIDGWKGNNAIIYDRVADAVFGLEVHKKIKSYHKKHLARLVELFLNAGKNTTDLDTFYQVVAKYNLPALFDFVKSRLRPPKKIEAWIDVVPFNWSFVFDRIDFRKTPEKQRKDYLKQFADFAIKVEFDQPAHLHVSRIWAALIKKLGVEVSYEVLREKISDNDTAQMRIRATYLLRDVENYDDEEHWKFLEEQVKINNPALLSEVSATIFTGKLEVVGKVSPKRERLIRWSKSENKALAEFARDALGLLTKEEKWFNE